MKNLDKVMPAIAIGLLLFLVCVLFKQTQDLQTQVDELKIIVDQEFLPAMILDKITVQ